MWCAEDKNFKAGTCKERGGGHSHMEVTGMCGHDPQSRGLSVTD